MVLKTPLHIWRLQTANPPLLRLYLILARNKLGPMYFWLNGSYWITTKSTYSIRQSMIASEFSKIRNNIIWEKGLLNVYTFYSLSHK